MTKTQPQFDPQLLDALLAQYRQPDDLLGSGGILEQLTKALLERALAGALNHHLGYSKHDPAGHHSGNSRNGTTSKTVKSKRGELRWEIPRDRNGEARAAAHPQAPASF